MKKALAVACWTVVGVAALAATCAIAAKVLSDRKLNRIVKVNVASIAIVDNDNARTRGKYLYDSRGCSECHGADGGGRVFIDDPNGLYVRSANITGGQGGAVKRYGNEDWIRTIRHGVKSDGRPMLVMPSEDYSQMTDEDLAALVAYIGSMPPVTGEAAETRLPLVVRALYVAGVVKDAAEKIDHSLPPTTAIGAVSNRGVYVANMCRGCHGFGFSGGSIPGAPPSWPAAANLTSTKDGAMSHYSTVAEFRTMMRTGKRPDGGTVNAVMPFTSLKHLDDADIDALFAYLKSLPARETGQR